VISINVTEKGDLTRASKTSYENTAHDEHTALTLPLPLTSYLVN